MQDWQVPWASALSSGTPLPLIFRLAEPGGNSRLAACIVYCIVRHLLNLLGWGRMQLLGSAEGEEGLAIMGVALHLRFFGVTEVAITLWYFQCCS